eukprot:4047411-Pyramimonas_sp.AAC.2
MPTSPRFCSNIPAPGQRNDGCFLFCKSLLIMALVYILLRFTGPPVPITARVLSTPQIMVPSYYHHSTIWLPPLLAQLVPPLLAQEDP